MLKGKTPVIKRSLRQHRTSDASIEAAFAPKPISEANKYATLLHDCFLVPFQGGEDTAHHSCMIRKHPEDRNMGEITRVKNILHLQQSLIPSGVNVIVSQYDVASVDGKECVMLKCIVRIDHTAKAVLDKINAERLAKEDELSASR